MKFKVLCVRQNDCSVLSRIIMAVDQTTTTTTTILRCFFRDHPGEPVPEENLWTFW